MERLGQYLPLEISDMYPKLPSGEWLLCPVTSISRRRGAYGRFKMLLAGRNLLDQWYAFSKEKTLSALGEWCASEGLAAQQDVDSSA